MGSIFHGGSSPPRVKDQTFHLSMGERNLQTEHYCPPWSLRMTKISMTLIVTPAFVSFEERRARTIHEQLFKK